MTHGTLVLQAPSECIPDQPALIARLSDLGFVGAGYGETPGVYLAGPRFLQLITFLGCSPHLQLEPPADGSEDFCHIRLRGPFRTARLLSAGNTRPPRCPGCGKGLTNWRQLESLWAKGVVRERNRMRRMRPECESCRTGLAAQSRVWTLFY